LRWPTRSPAILRREGKTAILVTHDMARRSAWPNGKIVLPRRPGRAVRSSDPLRHLTDPSDPIRGATLQFNGYFNILWQELEVHVEG
jgi:NitT/TauT family transport system ATP-binding protein